MLGMVKIEASVVEFTSVTDSTTQRFGRRSVPENCEKSMNKLGENKKLTRPKQPSGEGCTNSICRLSK